MELNVITASVVIMSLLQGCVAGSGISYVPERGSVKCNDVTRYSPQSSPISGWKIPYYIVPLGYDSWDNSGGNLKIRLYFKVEVSNRDYLSKEDFYLQRPEFERPIYPVSTKLINNNGHKTSRFLMYESDFAVKVGELEEFEIIFKRNIYGCNISPIKYKKSEYNSNQTNL